MSVVISWANKIEEAQCDISVGFPKSSHILEFRNGVLEMYVEYMAGMLYGPQTIDDIMQGIQ